MSEKLTVVAPTITEDFATARTYLQAAKASMAQSAAFMILAGAELDRLHAVHGISQGKRTDLTSPTCGGSWADIVKRELGISEETARRYREMFRAAKKRVPMLNADELLKTPIGELPALKQAKLMAAVQKVTDGETPRQLLMEWGIAKKPQGSGAKGGKRDAAGSGAVTPELLVEMKVALTDALINALDEALRDKPWNAADKAKRTKLHGLLEDVRNAVKETL